MWLPKIPDQGWESPRPGPVFAPPFPLTPRRAVARWLHFWRGRVLGLGIRFRV